MAAVREMKFHVYSALDMQQIPLEKCYSNRDSIRKARQGWIQEFS